MEQYRKMPKGQQDNIKDVGGFVLGKLKGGRRKKDCVISRLSLIHISWKCAEVKGWRASWFQSKCQG